LALAPLVAGLAEARADNGAGLDVSLGIASTETVRSGRGGTWQEAAGLGLLARYRHAHWLLGANLDLTTTFLAHNELFLGALAGAILDQGPWELTIAAEAGGHGIYGIGREFLSTVATKSAFLPHGGGRIGVDFVRRGTLRRIGIWAFARTDLVRKTYDIEPISCVWGCSGVGGRHDVGGTILGGYFRLGFGK
jgi:hypothetical protein